MREGASVSVILVNLACSHWASSLLIFLYAVPESDGVALSGRREEADFFSIKAATGIGSVQFGILCGFAFSGSYLVLGGAASSVVPQRRNLLIVGSLLSCASTVMTGLAGSFWELFSARAVLGLGEWFVNNASHGLLSDKCGGDHRSEANGIYVLGVYLGTGVASMSLAMASLVGWRSVCHIVALCRLIPALVTLCAVTERAHAAPPVPNGSYQAKYPRTERPVDPGDVYQDERTGRCALVGTILRSKLLIFLIAASSVRSMGTAAMLAFLPQFYAVCFPESLTTFSLVNAAAVAVGGTVSSSTGLRIVDYWVRQGNGRARVYVPAVGALLSLPFAVVVLFYDDALASMAALVAMVLFAECWLSPAISVLQLSLPPRLRGYSIAIIMATTTCMNATVLFLFGKLDERMASSDYATDIAMRFELILAVFATHGMSALLFYAASRCVHSTQSDESPVLFYEKQAFDALESFPFVPNAKGEGADTIAAFHQRAEQKALAGTDCRVPDSWLDRLPGGVLDGDAVLRLAARARDDGALAFARALERGAARACERVASPRTFAAPAPRWWDARGAWWDADDADVRATPLRYGRDDEEDPFAPAFDCDAVFCEAACLCGKKPRKLHRCARCRVCLLYTSPSPRDKRQSRMPSSA